ncbi:guanine nucleotide-binding protein G(s) subunit alpha isoforms XLas-like [Panicum virgatum]|uniref:Uncharacterized protein n=1 Tax=Panicum virgatum TaxID=38727 RepID=A0A8T0WCJ3_PANVG|nr:guanine nucleotide-binding protein G(s) subunit alpha isoforms XLas-like [Panicum virgatum]KAG2642392.1 hypothetical protein PVAP13_2KG274744 [Panicum virgatum]KAG2642393.1 hypothetical protein PVAP13_2KG274744 [Panicum virgatum]
MGAPGAPYPLRRERAVPLCRGVVWPIAKRARSDSSRSAVTSRSLMIAPCKTLAKQKGAPATAPLAGLVETRVRSLGSVANLDAVPRDDPVNQERTPFPPPASAGLGETKDGSPEPAAGRETSSAARTMDAERAAPPPPNDVNELDSPEDRDAEAFAETLTSNADVVLPDTEVRSAEEGTGSAEEERGPAAEETVALGSGETPVDPGAGRAPEASVDDPDSALARNPLPSRDDIASSPDPKAASLVTSEVAAQLPGVTPSPAPVSTEPSPSVAPTSVATMTVATRAGAGFERSGDAGAAAGGGWTSLGSVEALGLLASNYGGSNAELAAAMQNFEWRDLEFGRLRRWERTSSQ